MNHAAFKSWLDRYVDAWRLLDPVAIGDLFSRGRPLRLRPVRRGRRGPRRVVAAWLADPDEPGSWEADYEVLAIDGERVAHGRTRYLTDDRRPSTASSPTSSCAASTPTAAAASSPSGTCAGPEASADVVARRIPRLRQRRVRSRRPRLALDRRAVRARRRMLDARCPDAPNRPRRAGPGHLDRRQGIDDPEARGLRARGGQAGRPGHAVPGAVLRAVLLPGPGRPVLQLHGATSPTGRRRSGCRTSPSRPAWSSSRRCTRRTRRPRASTTTPPRSSTPTGRTSASTARRTSRTSRASGRSSTSGPGNLGYPVFETAVGKVGVYICYDRHFPEGARALGLNGAEIVLIPAATSRGLSEYLWRIEQVSHAVANGYFVGTINRVGIEPTSATTTSTARATSSTRAASSSARSGRPTTRSCIVRDLDLDLITEVRKTWQFYPRPPARRVRRPDAPIDSRYHPHPARPSGGGRPSRFDLGRRSPWRPARRRSTARALGLPSVQRVRVELEPIIGYVGVTVDRAADGSPRPSCCDGIARGSRRRGSGGRRDAVRLHAQARSHDRADPRADPPGGGRRASTTAGCSIRTSSGATVRRC